MIFKLFGYFITLLLCVRISKNHAFDNNDYLKKVKLNSDPDTYLTPLKIIRKNGYPAESHIVQSEDGYLLELHRIPHGKVQPVLKKLFPVLLHHGLLSCSIDWIINGPNKSLAYKLADEGYDVWIINARGNTFSRSHISINPSQREFWNFTFHEMGVYDLPATIDYILNTTNSKQLIYIGHSLGTAVFYVFASSRPEYNAKIKVQISLAPVAFLSHMTASFRYLVPYAKQIRSVSDWYAHGAFLEHDLMTQTFSKIFCGKNRFDYDICAQIIIFILFGKKDDQQLNKDLVPTIVNNLPAGTSGKNMIHCSQLISSGKFQQYDYGLAENIKRYHNAIPPAYNISSIVTPIKFYYGQNDNLANPYDVNLLYQHIRKPMGMTLINYEKFNHVDFMWSIDVNRLLNDQMLQFLNNVISIPDFIEKEIENAIEERAKNPPVIDEPFVADMNTNTVVTNFKRTVIKEIRTSIEKTADKVDEAIRRTVIKTTKKVKNSVQNLNRRFQASVMRKLKHILV